MNISKDKAILISPSNPTDESNKSEFHYLNQIPESKDPQIDVCLSLSHRIDI